MIFCWIYVSLLWYSSRFCFYLAIILRREAIVLVYGWWGVIGLDECTCLIVELTKVELYESAALVNRYGDLLRWSDVSVMILACISGLIDPIVIVDM